VNAGSKAAHKLKGWTAEEMDIVRRLYPDGGSVACQKYISRSLSAIQAKAYALDVTMTAEARLRLQVDTAGRARKPWKRYEDDILCDLYETGGARPVQEKLPHRTIEGIKMRAMYLGIQMSQQARADKIKDGRGMPQWDGRPEASAVNAALTMRW